LSGSLAIHAPPTLPHKNPRPFDDVQISVSYRAMRRSFCTFFYDATEPVAWISSQSRFDFENTYCRIALGRERRPTDLSSVVDLKGCASAALPLAFPVDIFQAKSPVAIVRELGQLDDSGGRRFSISVPRIAPCAISRIKPLRTI